jgi:hypothetical protein
MPRAYIDNLIVESGESRLMLFDQLWLELAIPVPRCLQFDLAEVAFQLLASDSVSRVAAVFACWIVLVVSQLLGQFAVQRAFQHCLGDLLQQRFNVLRRVPFFQPFIYLLNVEWPVRSVSHHVLLYFLEERLHRI